MNLKTQGGNGDATLISQCASGLDGYVDETQISISGCDCLNQRCVPEELEYI